VELAGTREEMRELGLRPPPKTVSGGAGGLTGREIEIARMVATRKSNKEIGSALEISARTVSTHLSNIFAKLSVGSRGELADFVRQSGLLEQ
jgi:DNA-binding CsgD family transcriptional regulator